MNMMKIAWLMAIIGDCDGDDGGDGSAGSHCDGGDRGRDGGDGSFLWKREHLSPVFFQLLPIFHENPWIS